MAVNGALGSGDSKMNAGRAHLKSLVEIRTPFILLIVSVLCMLVTFSVPLHARENEAYENVLEEVLVTASKRGEISAQDLAGAITAFDGKKLDRLKALEFDDLIVQVPSTNFINDGGPGRGNELASIRGLSPVADNTVGVVAQYLDGAPHFGNSYRVFDLAEVSVLRGPQGTLWGSQAIGGLISFRSNRPDPSALYGSLQGDVYSSEGDGGTSYRTYGMVNMPLVEDTFALRFAGHHIDESGYIENIRTGTGGINNVKESAWRLSGLWQATENATVTVIYHGNDLEADAPTYIDTALGGLQVDQPSDFGPTSQEYDLVNLIFDLDLGWAAFNYTGSSYSNVGAYSDISDTRCGWFPPPTAACSGLSACTRTSTTISTKPSTTHSPRSTTRRRPRP
jgi:outer membrane receptor protein involved in Fe transport